eukprot:TRINITY_DN116016_c0_g1_i1.p1 TRINITY_DN116016_c0_g1~~TRINITY_DN116016_c0_g1_i1.p1  ORF type:complete len:238 (-),score=7.86 TRINITY_DN116016_c0_g1_i1:96-746(-)
MTADRPPLLSKLDEAAKRAAERHGCCCSCCKLIWELYFAIGLDVLILVVGLGGLPTNAPESYVTWLCIYMIGVVFPSICAFARVIWPCGNDSGAPRVFLVRFLIFWKVPVYFLMYSTFFTISPWATEVAEFMCDPDINFENGKIWRLFPQGFHQCVAGLPKVMLPGMIPRLCIYMYSIKGAWEYMRCHPDNDDRSIFACSSAAREVTSGYDRLDCA